MASATLLEHRMAGDELADPCKAAAAVEAEIPATNVHFAA
jgi:hypothetical protein